MLTLSLSSCLLIYSKVGWNGVDNAVVCFDDLRVPRSALLDRLATVDAAGTFAPAAAGAESAGKRFAAMLQQLVLGRIMYIGGPAFYLQHALAITIRYAAQRRQFGPPGRGEEEVSIMRYPAHQSKLMRPLAAAFVLALAGGRVKVMYSDAAAASTAREALGAGFGGGESVDAMGTVHPLIAGLKAVASESCFRTICELRSACGGHGFLAKVRLVTLRRAAVPPRRPLYGAASFAALPSPLFFFTLSVHVYTSLQARLGNLRDDIDVFRTAEGENTVMLQQLAASLLKNFSASDASGDADDAAAIRRYARSLFPRRGAQWDLAWSAAGAGPASGR